MRCIALNAPQMYNPISPPSQNANERKSEGLAWIFARGILLPEGLDRRRGEETTEGGALSVGSSGNYERRRR